MNNIKIQNINKKDHETILNLYHKTYLALGEKRTKENISDFVNYLLKKPLKLKILYDNQIVWAFIADIKPRHTGSMLYDGEMFIDPEYQKMGFGTLLFRKSLEIAQEKYKVTDIVSFTFKDSYQLKWYTKLGIKSDNYWQMIYWKTRTIIKNLWNK